MAKRSTPSKNRPAVVALTAGATAAVGAVAYMSARAHLAAAQSAEVGSQIATSSEAIGAEYAQGAADRLTELIRFRTVDVPAPGRIELEEFAGFIQALERMYPAVHRTLERERVNSHALLFKWAGTAQDAASKPVVLMGHYDVVPVEPEDNWTHSGFSGHQDGHYVWGRGALDDKGAVVVILEAVESLLEQGFTPVQDIYLSFGNNEETAGDSAGFAAALLAERGVRPWMVLDEGGAVAEDAFPGLKRPAAVIGVAEKGILDLQLLARGAGGHASTPPRMGATARLARAIMALETSQMDASIPAPIEEMLRRIGAHSGFAMRLVTANLWAFKPLVTSVLSKVSDETRAMTGTTVVVTTLQGSQASNVLASVARANANIRIAVDESVESVVEVVRRIIDDPKIELTVKESHNPSPISPFDNEQFALLTRCVAQAYPQAMVTPYVQTGATDSRNFTDICSAVYRFSPLMMDAQDRASLHAVNEKVRISSLGAGVVFYRELIRSLE